jgi:Pectate lyase superfamily protein
MKKLLLTALLVPVIAFAQTYPSPTFNSVTLQNPLSAANGGTGSTTSTGTGSVALSNSPTFTGSPTVPGYLTTSSAASTYAPLASPTFTGSPTVPGYLTTASAASTYAPIASPSFTALSQFTNTSAGASVIKMTGNGATTPSKFFGVLNGAFTIYSSSGASQLLGLTDAGALSSPSIVTPTGGGTYYPTVPTNAALQGVSTTVTTVIDRLGYYSAGDSPDVVYKASASSCSLNSGAGDNGSQVISADAKCWLAQFPATGADIRQFGAKVDGATDDSSAVQNAIAYEATTGGIVLFPAGTTLLNTGVTVSTGGVTLKGIGWQEYSGTEPSSTPGPNSSWILSTSTAHSPVTFANTVENARLLDIAFRQTQPADTSGWTPTVYPPSIQINGGAFSSGAVDIENVFCWKCYSFVSMGSTGNFVGRITLKHLWGQPLSAGVTIIAASDTVLIDDVHFWPFDTASSHIVAWVLANGVGFNLFRADNPIIQNVFMFDYNIGVLFSTSTDGSSQHFQLNNLGCDTCNQGIIFNEGANGANGTVSNFYVQIPSGVPNTSNGLTVNSGVTGLTVDMTNFRATGAGGSCISLVGASDISSVNTWCDGWNLAGSNTAAFVAGSSSVLTLGGRQRTNGGGAAVITGGSGIINNTHVN